MWIHLAFAHVHMHGDFQTLAWRVLHPHSRFPLGSNHKRTWTCFFNLFHASYRLDRVQQDAEGPCAAECQSKCQSPMDSMFEQTMWTTGKGRKEFGTGLQRWGAGSVLRPLQLPQVAADAEFSSLPFLGWALSGLGTLVKNRNWRELNSI